MLQEVYQALRTLVSNGRYDKSADEGRKLFNALDFRSFSALLPYRYFDSEDSLFINSHSVGFALEVMPLTGANEQIAIALDDFIRHKLPNDMVVSVMLYANKHVASIVDKGLANTGRQSKQDERFRAIARNYYKQAITHRFPNRHNYPLSLRDYRLFFFFSRKVRDTPAVRRQMVQERLQLTSALEMALLYAVPFTLQHFLILMRELLQYDINAVNLPDSTHDAYTELSQQLVAPSFNLHVEPEQLTLQTGGAAGNPSTAIITTLSLKEKPEEYALWMTGNSYQSLFEPAIGIPCPFFITLTFQVEAKEKARQEAGRKYLKQDKNAGFALSKYIPRLRESANEWHTMRDQLEKDETALCYFSLNVVLFSDGEHPETALKDKHATLGAFRKNELELHCPQYQQLPLFLSCLPFMATQGVWEDLGRLGNRHRVTSFNVANLLPVVADKRLCSTGLLLPSYRNQITFFNPFDKAMGQANYNMAVTATSGAGKSVFAQSVFRDVLSRQGIVWVVDVGNSYKNFCELIGGRYLYEDSLRFNPFADVTNIAHSAEKIRDFLAVLASCDGYLDDVHKAVLLESVEQAWARKGNSAIIDDVLDALSEKRTQCTDNPQPEVTDLITLLSRYRSEGIFGHYFNASQDELGDNAFTVLELGNLKDQPDLMTAILFAFILKVEEKMYHPDFDGVPKLCGIDEAWRFLNGDNKEGARFLNEGMRTVRKHGGAFMVITQGIGDFFASDAAKAAWNCSAIKITMLQEARSFKTYLDNNPTQFSAVEKKVIQGFEDAQSNHFSSLMISVGESSSFHRLFLDPVSRVMMANTDTDRQTIRQLMIQGYSLEEAIYQRACELYPDEMEVLSHG